MKPVPAPPTTHEHNLVIALPGDAPGDAPAPLSKVPANAPSRIAFRSAGDFLAPVTLLGEARSFMSAPLTRFGSYILHIFH